MDFFCNFIPETETYASKKELCFVVNNLTKIIDLNY